MTEEFSPKKVWNQLFSWEVASRTNPSTLYRVTRGDIEKYKENDGWRCSCPDWVYRRGSLRIHVKQSDGTKKLIQGCRHIRYILDTQGLI